MSESEKLRKEAEALMLSGDYPQARKLLVHARFSATDAAEKQALLDLQLECEKALTGSLDDKVANAESAERSGATENAIKLYEEAFAIADKLGTAAAGQQRMSIADNLANLYLGLRQFERAHHFADISGRPIKPLTGLPAKSALQILKQNGKLSEMNDAVQAELLDELDTDIDDVDTMSMLTAFYDFGLTKRGQRDGFLAHDWRFGQETDDVVAEFSALVGGGEPLLKFVKFDNDTGRVEVERRSGEVISAPFDGSLDDVAAVFNLELERFADKRRFVSLHTEGDFFSYYLLDLTAYKNLCTAAPPALPAAAVPGIDEPQWDVVFVR